VAESVYVEMPQLRGLLSDIAAVDRDLARQVRQAIHDGAEPILAMAKRGAPYDAAHRGWEGWDSSWRSKDPGHLRDSLYLQKTSGTTVNLRSTHPGAEAHHWGGTIAPRGTPITIRGNDFATRAGKANVSRVSEYIEREIYRLLVQHNL
jgi:hypothetical protein